jgi:septal ring factor EnvC (AmiA/AmiB activator)
MRSELDQIDRDLVSIGAKIIDPTLTAEQRAQLVVDTKHLAERKGEIKTRIPQVEHELAASQRDLDDYRATLNYIE